jgi:uncharacterized protein YjiS (DUF1127 family)
MSTIYDEAGFGQSATPPRRVSSFLKSCWNAFLERRRRLGLRTTLSHLSDRELADFGMTRGEIDYVASNRVIDPRSVIAG